MFNVLHAREEALYDSLNGQQKNHGCCTLLSAWHHSMILNWKARKRTHAAMALALAEWHFDSGDPEEIFTLEGLIKHNSFAHSITEEIARGTYGIVYKAKHNETGKPVALKILKPEEDDDISFLVELLVLGRCKNQNLCNLVGSWKIGGEIFVCGTNQPFLHTDCFGAVQLCGE